MNNRFVMLIGIAGSGKTTYAYRFRDCLCDSRERATIFSSDDIREEFYGDASIQGDNTSIFGELNARTLHHLSDGYTAIYDATNLNKKRRVQLLQKVYSIDPSIERICIVFQTPPKTCIARNQLRERVVPEEVIKRQYHQFEYPTYDEGWHKIYNAPSALEEDLSIVTRPEQIIAP